MALNLPQLSGQFETLTGESSLVMPGTKLVVPQNSKRLALGISHAAGTAVAVFPLINQQFKLRFFLPSDTSEWFYWEKHATILSFPWFFETSNLAGDSVIFVDIYQSSNGQ